MKTKVAEPEIIETKKYSMSGSINSNREVDETHVKKLIKAIQKKNLLKLNPIIVNKKHEVIDGQHRLEAATRMKLPIYYLVSEEISKDDISSLNTNSKSWKPLDYINYWTIEGAAGFDIVSRFINDNPHFAHSTCLRMLSIDGANSGYKEGRVDVSNYQNANKIAEIVKNFRNHCDFAFDRGFVMAIAKIYETGLYDHEVMKKRLETQSRSLVKCISIKQYVEMLEEIYNYRSSANRVRFF